MNRTPSLLLFQPMPDQKPDGVISFSDGSQARLFRHAATVQDGERRFSADLVILQHLHGIEEEVVVFEVDGEKVVRRKQLTMNFPPGGATRPTVDAHVVELDSEQVKRWLAIYDRFPNSESGRNGREE